MCVLLKGEKAKACGYSHGHTEINSQSKGIELTGQITYSLTLNYELQLKSIYVCVRRRKNGTLEESDEWKVSREKYEVNPSNLLQT